jgi:superfamily II DNA/RNA helicase
MLALGFAEQISLISSQVRRSCDSISAFFLSQCQHSRVANLAVFASRELLLLCAAMVLAFTYTSPIWKIRPDRQTLLFSATLPSKLRAAAKEWLPQPVVEVCKPSLSPLRSADLLYSADYWTAILRAQCFFACHQYVVHFLLHVCHQFDV